MATRYGVSTRAGTTFSKDELDEKGIKKVVVYARRPTWTALDALQEAWGLDSRSAVVAKLAKDAAKKEKIAIDDE